MKNLSMIYRLGEIWYYPTIKNKYFRFKKESKTAIVIHIMNCYQDKLILNFDISN
jgi:hypothetical protein